jgi:phosphoserine phosphatase
VRPTRNPRIPAEGGGARKIESGSPGAELAYLLRHDPQFRGVRREHLREVGNRVRLKDDLNIFARVLREHLSARFHSCVISASPREVVQSALERIVPAENVFGTEFAYDDRTGEISGIVHVSAHCAKASRNAFHSF